MIDVSIVIVSYNTRRVLRDCLSSVSAGCRGVNSETFVVDNASQDDSAGMIRAEFGSIRLIENPTNVGFAAANNQALNLAGGRYVVLLNPDTVLGPGSITTLVRFMDGRPAAGYCGPRLVNGDRSHQPSSRRFPSVFTPAFAMLGLDRRWPTSRHSGSLHGEHGDRGRFRADWLSGACLMVRRAAIEQVGLLDEGFFMYFEETDWCHRMAEAGWEGWYLGDAEVVHLGGQSVSHGDEAKPFSGDHPVHWIRSSRRYKRRYFGWSGMVISEVLLVLLYVLIWMRHRWRTGECSVRKARTASAALHHLLASSQA